MRIKQLFFFLFLAISTLSAQQEQQYTQFMFNKIGYNPGYAGAQEARTLSLLYRSQWAGLEGAPNVQALSYSQSMLNERVGLGVNLVRHAVAINRSTTADIAYSYRVNMRGGASLGIGIQASMRYLYQNWADPRLKGTQPLATDQAIPLEAKSKVLPNFGFGMYYHKEKYYCGISIPRLVSNNIDFAELGRKISREVQHVYAMGGIRFEMSEGLNLMPQVLLKYVKNAPFDADINCNAEFKDRFIVGLTYRTGSGSVTKYGESIDILTGVQATKNLYFGLSYDIGLTKLRNYNNGSIEATIRYFINPPEGDSIESPRNFKK
jgi:type IX secretion system PorP/SprF family membrane protein